MEQVKLFCTNVLSTHTAFAIRSDNGEQVFIPSYVAQAANLQPTDTVIAHVVPNTHHPEKTPWFAIRVDREVGVTLSSQPAPQPEKTIDDRIAEYIDGQPLYATTAEVAEEFSIDTTLAGNALIRLFRQGRVVRAEVHSRPEQQRASFCLWAKDTARFVEGIEL
jgi:hypothetical protein